MADDFHTRGRGGWHTVAMPSERRRYPRVQVRPGTRADITSPMMGTARGWIRNISLGGMLLETEAAFPLGCRVSVEARLRLGPRVHEFHARGWVAHTHGGLGIQFFALSDEAVAAVTLLLEEQGDPDD